MRQGTFNLSELLISLSNAMDLASPLLTKHQQKTTYIAWKIADQSKMDHNQKENLFLASILHDIGALTTDEKIDLHEMETLNASHHCIVGHNIYKQVSWLKPASEIVLKHHDQWGKVEESLEDSYRLESQVLYLADTVERFIDKNEFILYQKDDIYKRIKDMIGDHFHKDVVDMFLKASKPDQFWLDLSSPRLDIILERIFTKRSIYLSLDEMQDLAMVFKNIIDFRTPFTATHSTGVAACASKLAEIIGFSKQEVILMRIAGYLHDIGKLAIPNKLLDKPSGLTKDEFAIIRQHVYYTHQVLNGVAGFERIKEWAVCHHEKLNGTGYPFSLDANDISIGARIFAVADIFTALSEDRPYRKAMTFEEIERIMLESVQKGELDSGLVNVLFDNRDLIYNYVVDEKEIAMKNYNIFIHGAKFKL